MIELRDVTIQAGKFRLEQISFTIPQGSYGILMGQTGKGKTTLLESICGLRSIQSGNIRVQGQDVTGWLPGDREVGYVPQDLALFPTMTVEEHLAFALRLRKYAADERRSRVEQVAEVLGIGALLSRGISDLSGGESQRVALGRAISFRPSVLLLDEPLSALDDETRTQMHETLKELQQTTGVTVLHVTHSQQEADVLADHRFELIDGKIVAITLRVGKVDEDDRC